MRDRSAHPRQRVQRTPSALPAWMKRLWSGILRYIWYVHPGAYLRVKLSPSQSYKILETAAKPSVNRLHLRNVFTRGRRYFIDGQQGGFTMLTTNKALWNRRGRTRPTAVLLGHFERIDEQTTLITMQSRVRLLHLLRSFFWPLFITSMLVYMSWHPLITAAVIVALFTLAWLAQRFDSQLEAHEMVFFVEKALEDFIPETPHLSDRDADLVLERETQDGEFASVWDKFYETLRD